MTDSDGHVWIVGAGPGDPGLITVAGARAIAEADVILYDALTSPALLRGARADAEVVYVGKRAADHALTQAEIEALVVRHALDGRRVVRLKGGDPFVFGRGGEEALACRKAGVRYTIVPGVTSAIGAPAYAGIPVTHRGLSGNVLVVTASDAGDEGRLDWEFAARADTLVILMGAAGIEENMARLQAAGKPAGTPAASIRWGTRADQQVVTGTVGTIGARARAAGLTSPAVTVVGEVAKLAGEIGWFEPGPLAGKRVVVTRARAQASDLASRLEALGAMVIEAPVIAAVPRKPNPQLSVALSSGAGWIVFTSANGVEAALGCLRDSGLDARALAGARIAAIGEPTARALAEGGLRADFAPTRATSACLAAELPDVQSRRVVLPVSALTDENMAAALEVRGARVEQIVAYDTVLEPLDDERRREVAEADAVTFTSASTARNLREALCGASLAANTRLVSIGPRTSEAVVAEFGRVDREAQEPSLESLVEAVVETLTWG
jgi:uroporphyrinogen III methyltransferase/synthase